MMSDPNQAILIAWTQLAWMQEGHEAMMCRSALGWPHALKFEDEVHVYEGSDDFHAIDIAAELWRLASDGLFIVKIATIKAACLQEKLESVSDTLFYLLSMPAHIPGFDNLEHLAARAVIDVDELLRKHTNPEAPPLPFEAVDELKLLQKHLQDIVIGACSRFIDQVTLQKRGIPTELLKRLEAVFSHAELADDALWSRLGNSKFHVLTQGVRFGQRKQRHGRCERRNRIPCGEIDFEVSTEARDPAASSSLG
jgi:hypothetical protein